MAGATAGGLAYLPQPLTFSATTPTQSVPPNGEYSTVLATWVPDGNGGLTYVPIVGIAGNDQTPTTSNFEVDAFQPTFTPVACVGVGSNGALAQVGCPVLP